MTQLIGFNMAQDSSATQKSRKVYGLGFRVPEEKIAKGIVRGNVRASYGFGSMWRLLGVYLTFAPLSG